VTTKLASIQVVGTRFAVRADIETSVDVENGVVACTVDSGQTEQLSKGQHVTINPHGITPPKSFDVERTFAWLKGRLIFRDQPLSVVVQELQRYHVGKIYIVDKTLANIHITGNYKLNDTQAIINTLAQVTGAKVRQLSPYLIVLSLPDAI
jgi:transmembrane sensor